MRGSVPRVVIYAVDGEECVERRVTSPTNDCWAGREAVTQTLLFVGCRPTSADLGLFTTNAQHTDTILDR